MKGIQGFMDLIILVVFMMASVPLLVTLIITSNKTKMNYLEDKTMFTLTDSIEYDLQEINGRKVYMPKSLAPLSLDYGGAQVLALIQDDYCPDDGTNVYYDYDANSVFTTINPLTDANLVITDSWKTVREAKWQEVLSKSISTNTAESPNTFDKRSYEKFGNQMLNIIWSANQKCWVITYNNGHIINIFE